MAAAIVVVVETLVGVPGAAATGGLPAYLAMCAALGLVAAAVAGLVVGSVAPPARVAIRAMDAHASAAGVHGTAAGACVLAGGIAGLAWWIVGSTANPLVVAAGGALASIGVGAIALGVATAVRRTVRGATHSTAAAVGLWLALAWLAAGFAMWQWLPFRNAFPARAAASLTLFGVLMFERDRLGAASARRWVRTGGAVLAAGSFAVFAFVDDARARRAVLESPTLSAVMASVRWITDVDRDGYGSLLGEADCAPWDGDIHPGARDIAGDGIDQNCLGGDFVPQAEPSPHPDTPVPRALARDDWNVLLVTVDTLRYDRATTPTLAALGARGAWFERAYATGCNTTDSLPALISGRHLARLRLDGGRLAPEVTTLAEALRAAGYRTGMFTSHRYFDGWGLDQGFDVHVNDRAATGAAVTDQAHAWIRGGAGRWFAWIHYDEPHQPYEGEGDTLVERYESEVRTVDAQLARLLSATDDRTIVVVTADHGELLGEGGVYGHPASLVDPLIRVPLIVVVPGAEPRRVTTPASLIDVAPTIAAFAGVRASDEWSGRAHVAEIALGRDRPERVVFAAVPRAYLYAAMSTGGKVIRNERIGTEHAAGSDADRVRDALTDWRERMLGVELWVD